MARISRRKFLYQVAAALAAVEAGHIFPAQAAQTAAETSFPLVAVAQGSNEDTPEQILRTALAGIGGMERFVSPGQVVAIKPNATWAFRPHTGSATDPDVLRAVIKLVREAGAKRVIVMDHCSIDPGTAEALRLNQLGKVMDEMGVEKIVPDRFNAPRSTYTRIDLPNGKAFKNIGVIKAALEVDVRINLGLAKSHNVTKYSMCLKHMMGFMEVPQNLHTNLEQGIADINGDTPIKPALNILEAIRVRMPWGDYRVCAGPETDLSHPNIVKRLNQMVVGTDPVLVDAYGCVEFFKIQPDELTHVLRAAESGVGRMDVAKALAEGVVRVFRVGQPITTPTPAATTTTTAAPVNQPTRPALQISTPQTPTPQPTATSAPTAALPVGEQPAASSPADEVMNPNAVLSGALIPAAAVVLGAGLVAANRLARQNPSDEPEDA